MRRVVILDTDATLVHGNSVKAAIVEGYGSDIGDQIEIRVENEDFGSGLDYARSIGAVTVVRSTTGLVDAVPVALCYYPMIQTFMPFALTANDGRVELEILDDIPIAIVTCGGETTGYGIGLEFQDTLAGGLSGGNGRVAGKLLKIRDMRGGSWWDARYAARQTASNHGVWNEFTGYGQIDVASAIGFSGLVPPDPYLSGSFPDVIIQLGGISIGVPGLEIESIE